MKNLLSFGLPAFLMITIQACSLPRYEAGTYVPPSNTSAGSVTSGDPANSRPTDGTTFTGATPTGANSGTSPTSYGMPSMGTANSTSSGISGDELAAEDAKRVNSSFVNEAAINEASIIEFTELALKNAQHDDVKNLAGTLLKVHQSAIDELQALAKAKGITTPQNPGTALKKLLAVSTKDFDQAYLDILSLEQEKELGLFKEAARYSDPVIKAYASKYVPVFKIHEKQAIRLSKEIRKGN